MKLSVCVLPLILALPAGCTAASTDSDPSEGAQSELRASTSDSRVEVELQAVTTALGADAFCIFSGANVHFTYENRTLPWGTRVRLHMGFEGVDAGYDPADGSGQVFPSRPYSWRFTRDFDLEAAGPYVWSATPSFDYHTSYTPASEGVTKIDFAFKITLPDGSVIWDSAGRPSGYYAAPYTYTEAQPVCDAVKSFTPRAVSRH